MQGFSSHTHTHTLAELSLYLARQTALFELSLSLKAILIYTILPVFIAPLCVLCPLPFRLQWFVCVCVCLLLCEV